MAGEDLSQRFDNIDVYRMVRENLFGVFPEYPEGQQAPTRSEEAAAAVMPETGGLAIRPALEAAPWALAGAGFLASGAVSLLLLRRLRRPQR